MAYDPRGVKVTGQTYKVYYAATKDPAAPGEWTLSSVLEFVSLQGQSGPQPNVCILKEIKAPAAAFKAEGSPAAFEEATTGGGTTGTIFCGAEITVDSLVRVEASVLGSPSTYKPIFLGVVVKSHLDLGTEFIEWQCEDYRHFMRKACVYGRMIFDPNAAETPVFIRGARTTLNAGGKPDHYQEGTALSGNEWGRSETIWLPPMWNRADQTVPGGPADDGGDLPNAVWADYWLAGHAWNYIRTTYFDMPPLCFQPPSEENPTGNGLALNAFINMPSADEDPEAEDMFWMFYNDVDGRVILSDFAVTGMGLDRVLTLLLQKAGPYDWTLVPNADGNTADIVTFHTHEGVGDPLDYIWGDYGQAAGTVEPDVLDGKIARDQSEFYNRGYAISRRRVVETTFTTREQQFASGAPASLVMDALPADVTAYLAAVAAGGSAARKDDFYGAVYRRYRVPNGYDWGTWVFSGSKLLTTGALGLRQLLTMGAAFTNETYDKAPVFRPLRTMVWRNTNIYPAAPAWEPKPDYISVEVLADACGITLGSNARDGKDPWTWNGDTDSPVVYELMVTMAVEVTEPIEVEVDETETGDRAREYFLDGGNVYRSAARINAVMPIKAGAITANAPTSTAVKGTPAVPDVFIDEDAQLGAELSYRMEIKNAINISGNLVLWGLRIDPWPIGHLVGELTVPENGGEDPPPNLRSSMQLNACIRGFRMDREADTTTYTLDGR